MQYHLSHNQVFTGQENAIKSYGDFIWNALCDHNFAHEQFTIAEMTESETFCRAARIVQLASKTRRLYVKAVLHNVRIEGEKLGDPQITRLGRFWFLAGNVAA